MKTKKSPQITKRYKYSLYKISKITDRYCLLDENTINMHIYQKTLRLKKRLTCSTLGPLLDPKSPYPLHALTLVLLFGKIKGKDKRKTIERIIKLSNKTNKCMNNKGKERELHCLIYYNP